MRPWLTFAAAFFVAFPVMAPKPDNINPIDAIAALWISVTLAALIVAVAEYILDQVSRP